jgi:uncharacterized lipoprotein
VRSDRATVPLGLALLAVSGALTIGALSGCSTTQETAVEKKAESKRILEQRELRRQKNRHDGRKGGTP